MERPDSVIRVKCDGDFYVKWMEFLRPFHKMAKRESEIAGAMLKVRAEIVRGGGEGWMADEALMSKSGRERIAAEAGITMQHLQVAIGKFRKSGFMEGDVISKYYIPDEGEGEKYMLLVYFVR